LLAAIPDIRKLRTLELAAAFATVFAGKDVETNKALDVTKLAGKGIGKIFR
jgi:hypothetical protein